MADSPVLERVRALVAPIASDLQLDIYDIEQRGGTLRITLDGSDGPIDLEQIALATRLISRELDHNDPIPGRYTLEVSSPGVERALRRPEHFTRALGASVTVRLVAPDANGQRRFEGTLVGADASTATVLTDTGERTLPLSQIERARTVFDWSPAPKPGKGHRKGAAQPADDTDADDTDDDDDADLWSGDDEDDDGADFDDTDDIDIDNETETP